MMPSSFYEYCINLEIEKWGFDKRLIETAFLKRDVHIQ